VHALTARAELSRRQAHQLHSSIRAAASLLDSSSHARGRLAPLPTSPPHCSEYLDFLSKVTPNNQEEFRKQMVRFNLGPVGEADCPVFDGMLQYCQVRLGGELARARTREAIAERSRACRRS